MIQHASSTQLIMISYLESKNSPNDEKGSAEESLKTESNNGNIITIFVLVFSQVNFTLLILILVLYFSVKNVELVENDPDSGAVNLFSSRGINICSPFNVHNSHKPGSQFSV